LNAIYYGVYTGHGPLSWYIRAFTWSSRSHAAAFRPPNDSGEFGNVIEAWRGGVCERHWTKGHRRGTIIDVYRVRCSDRQAEKFYIEMAMKKGKKYDFLGIASFGLRMNIGRNDRWFCSEAVFDSALRAGIVLLAGVPAYKVFPGMLDMVPSAELATRLVVQ